MTRRNLTLEELDTINVYFHGFKAGDRLRVLHNKGAENRYALDEIVTVTEVPSLYYVTVRAESGITYRSQVANRFVLEPETFSTVSALERTNTTPMKVQTGDKLRVIHDIGVSHRYKVGDVVTAITDADGLRVNIKAPNGSRYYGQMAARFVSVGEENQRAEIVIKSREKGRPPIYIYIHDGAETVLDVVRDGLVLAESAGRLEDPPYLARIIFERALRDAPTLTSGVGIGTVMGDAVVARVYVLPESTTVNVQRFLRDPKGGPAYESVSFADIISPPPPPKVSITLDDLSPEAVEALGWSHHVHALNSIRKLAREGGPATKVFDTAAEQHATQSAGADEISADIVIRAAAYRLEAGKR